MRGVLAADQGTPTMIEIAAAIQEGAMAYLRRQFKTIAVILIPLAIVVFVTSTEVTKPLLRRSERVVGPHVRAVRSVPHPGVHRRLRRCPGLTGFIGMSLAVRGNVRTAAAARRARCPPRSRSRSAPAASPACSPSASVCSARRSSS